MFVMVLPPIPQRLYHLAFLAVCVALSSYGITAGKPVLQIGALRFPYSETLPFPYPITTTLFQFTCTHIFILLAGLFARSVNKSIDDVEGRGGVRFTGGNFFKNSICNLNWVAILKIFPLAFTVAAEAAVGNYVLYNKPFEAYLVSRALILPLLLLLDRFVYSKIGPGRLLYPSMALSISVFITAFKPPLPHTGHTFLVIISASVLSALWTLQIQIYDTSLEPSSKGEYSVVGSAETVAKTSGVDTYTTSSLLYYVSLLSTTVLVPIVLYSGEPSHILRNCYFLSEFRFWQYMAAGAIFRLAFFTSMMLLIEKTSALTTTFFYILVTVTQITVFTFNTLGRLQLIGLTGSLISTLWFYVTSTEFKPTLGPIWQSNISDFRRRSYSTMLVIAIVIMFGSVSQIFHHEGIVDSSPPPDTEDTGDFPATFSTSMVQGADSYLGHRPPANSIVDFKLLMEGCEGMRDSVSKDVFRCLEFLSTKQDTYIISPSEPPKTRSDDDDLDVEKSPDKDPAEISSDTCDGPIIPYHIWGGHSPTWRIELFMKAYLHTQNLHCSRLWIWVDGKHEYNTLSKWRLDQRFRRFTPLIDSGDIILKEWILPARVLLPSRNTSDELDQARYYKTPGPANSKGERLVADSVVQDASDQEWLQFYEDEHQVTYYEKAISDVARFTIVHMYGGIYLDSGTILLRDIRPLLLSNTAFIEKPDPREPFGNAIIAVPANSSISSYMLRSGTRMGLFFHAAVLQRVFVQEGRDANNYNDGGLVRLEDAIFDPIWAESHGLREGRCTVPCLNSYVSVFKAAPVRNEWESFDGEPLGSAAHNRTLENFYPGAFAYHIHGQKKTQYERGSWMDVICSAHDKWFAGEQLNSYGEKWQGSPITNYRHSS